MLYGMAILVNWRFVDSHGETKEEVARKDTRYTKGQIMTKTERKLDNVPGSTDQRRQEKVTYGVAGWAMGRVKSARGTEDKRPRAPPSRLISFAWII